MFDKIDKNDISVQVESKAVDVWVPQGLAIYPTDSPSFTGAASTITFSDGLGMVTSLDSSVKPIKNTNGDMSYRWEKSKSKSNIIDVWFNNGNNTANPVRAQEIGPIILQNRVPFPVRPNQLVKMAGKLNLRRTGIQQKDRDGNNTTVYLKIELTAVGYRQDEYGEEVETKLPLMNLKKNLQLVGSGGVGDAFVEFDIAVPEYLPVPYGTDRVFISVTAYEYNNDIPLRLQYESGYWFVSNKEFMVLPASSPLSVIVANPKNEPSILGSYRSPTNATFHNRRIFENVYPLFVDQLVTNSDFQGTAGWNLIASSGPMSSINIDTTNKVATVSTVANLDGYIESSDEFTVVSGEKFYVETWVKKDNSAGAATVYTYGSTQTGVKITSSPVILNSISSSEYTKVSGIVTAPSGATTLKFGIWAVVTSPASNKMVFDKIVVQRLKHDSEITFNPDSNGTNAVHIFEWSGVRGAKLATLPLDPLLFSQTIDISSRTGQIEVTPADESSTPVNGGAKQSSQQVKLSQNVWTNIINIIPDPLFLGTVIQNNSIRAGQSGVVSVYGEMGFKEAPSKIDKGFRVLKNGVVVEEFVTTALTSGMSGTTPKFSVTAGDMIAFQAISGSNFSTLDPAKIKFNMLYETSAITENSFFVQSCWAKKYESLYQTQTRSISRDYVDIVDDVASVKISQMEADAGVMTIKFATNQLDPATNALLQIGKSIRILGRHYGFSNQSRPSNWTGPADYSPVFTGTIKRVEVTYDYQNEPQLTVTAYNCYQRLDSISLGVVHQDLFRYGPALNSLGVPVYMEHESTAAIIEWTGQQKEIPAATRFWPASYGQYSLADALILSRNSKKAFIYVSNRDELFIKNNLQNNIKSVFTDGTLPGDLSMSDIKMGADTDNIINIIEIEENLIDRKDFLERSATSDEPPEMLKTLQGKKRTIQYLSKDSVSRYGEYSKKFQVVRGTGYWYDLKRDEFGDGFEEWAKGVIERYAQPLVDVASIKVPIKNSRDIKLMSEIEILDRVNVGYKGQYFDLRVREIEHNITPGKWVVEIKFQPKADMTYWT